MRKGTSHSEEVKNKISCRVKQLYVDGILDKNKIRERLILANTGRHHTEEAKKKISETHKGMKYSEETKNKIRISKIGKKSTDKTRELLSNISRNRWKYNKEYVEKVLKSINTKPNKEEILLNDIIQSTIPGEYKINVRADVMILGGKIPDFVNVNGKKKVIELFGRYWHDNKNLVSSNKNYKRQSYEDRIGFFKNLGWDTLIIWNNELKDLELVKSKLLAFNST